VIEADGVRNIGGVALDQAATESSDALAASGTVVVGSTYVIQSRHGRAILRIVRIRGIESVRNAPPAALRTPRVGGSDHAWQADSERSNLTMMMEWILLTP
jgi:hypothetical protein